MSRGDDQVRIQLDAGAGLTAFRLSSGLHTELKDAATSNGRSMNAEIVARLERSFLAPGLHAEVADVINRYIDLEVQARLRAIAIKLGGAS